MIPSIRKVFFQRYIYYNGEVKIIVTMSRHLSYEIEEADQRSTLLYSRRTVEQSFVPLVAAVRKGFERCRQRPYIVSISGPPGCGKSSISSLFEILLEREEIDSVVLPLDGFHFTNEELETRKTVREGREVSLSDIKGARETYDIRRLASCFSLLRSKEPFYWPLYSRSSHSPVEKGIRVTDRDRVYIVEGNYLLLNIAPWSGLSGFFDLKVFIRSKPRWLKTRVITRKRRGGFTKKEARDHYRHSDSYNITEVLDLSCGYDYLLLQKGRYRYVPIEAGRGSKNQLTDT